MAMEDIFEGGLGTGLLFGLGAVVIAPLATKVLRPVAKAVIKGGMSVYNDTGLGDATEDLIAEARSEYQDAQRRDSSSKEQAARPARRTEPQPA